MPTCGGGAAWPPWTPTKDRDKKKYTVAKRLLFNDNKAVHAGLHRGWQDWMAVNAEVAIPEPFFLHSGVNVRAGFNVCEVFDLVLAVLGGDLYGDAAYNFDGSLKYPATAGEKPAPADKKGPSAEDELFGDP